MRGSAVCTSSRSPRRDRARAKDRPRVKCRRRRGFRLRSGPGGGRSRLHHRHRSDDPPAGASGRAVLGLQGEDLLGGLEAGKGAAPTPETRSLYCESLSPTRYGCNPLFGILDGRWKYILSTRPELYNLEADPGETKDLIQQEPGRADLLRGKLQTLHGRAPRLGPGERPRHSRRGDPGAATLPRVRLPAARCIETFTVDPARPDAKDRIGAHVAFGDAIRLEGERKLDQARAVVADLEQRYPGLTDVEMFRGLIEFESGNAKEAVSHYEAGLALMEKEAAGRSAMTVNPDKASGHYQLANALAETDRKEDALNEYHEAIHLNGRYVDAWFNLGVTLAQWAGSMRRSALSQKR